MEELNAIVCKSCGARLRLSSAADGVLECEYCGNTWVVPRPSTPAAAINFLNIGQHDLDTCKFEDAFEAFKTAADIDPKEPEAFFGMALARFRVQQIKNQVSGRIQPVCHIKNDALLESKSFVLSDYYLRALERATASQREKYKKTAEEIEHIRCEFLELKRRGIEYDCFICVKVSDNGSKTTDSRIADEIYLNLRRHGYKPFYSERELKNRTGADYEAYILYALYNSECMLVVCTNEEYLNTDWVKNEYTRFLSMIGSNGKENDSIAIVYPKGNRIESLPGKMGKIQGIEIGSLDSGNLIIEYVEVHSPEGKKRRDEEIRKKREEEQRFRQSQEELRRQFEEQNRRREEEDKKKEEAEKKLHEEQEKLRRQFEEQNRIFEEKLRSLRGGAASAAEVTVESLLMRGNQFLEGGDEAKAAEYYNKALDVDPQCGEAWWRLFLMDFGAKNESMVLDSLSWQNVDNILANRNYINAVRYGDGEIAETIEKFNASMKSPERWWNNFLAEMGGSEEEITQHISRYMLQRIRSSKNLSLAKRYADDEYKKRIDGFEAALDSVRAQWDLFLEDMRVRHEDELLSSITDGKLTEIAGNEHFLRAKEIGDREFGERIAAFERQLHSGILWYKAFLKSMGVADRDGLLRTITPEKLPVIERNPFFLNARKFRDLTSDEEMESLETALHSGELWLERFFEVMGAKDENDILLTITPDKLRAIENSGFYKNAVGFADGEVKDRLDEFNARLYSGELWLNRLLETEGVIDESDLLIGITPEKKTELEGNAYFCYAKKYARGEAKKRIERFAAELCSSELWLKRFFEDLGLKNENDLLYSGDSALLRSIPCNKYYKLASAYNGDAIKKFNDKLYSFGVWFKCFLRSRNVRDADAIVDSIDEIDKASEIVDEAAKAGTDLNFAVSYAKGDDKKEVEAFLDRLRDLLTHYKAALQYKSKILAEFGLSDESQLLSIRKPITKGSFYPIALKEAKLSRDKKLIAELEELAKSQGEAAKQNAKYANRARTKMAFRIIFRVIAALTPFASLLLAVTIVLYRAHVDALTGIWKLWEGRISDWLTIPLFIIFLLIFVRGLVLLIKRQWGARTIVYTVISLVIILGFLGLSIALSVAPTALTLRVSSLGCAFL